MKERAITPLINRFCFEDHKMAFVSGPRQCGKTTLAKALLKQRSEGRYYNWDETAFRRAWVKHPSQLLPPKHETPALMVLDEIHKAKQWKRTLKGIYDTLNDPVDIMVTGSARLNIYKKGSDSLLGRYYHFRLHPFSVRELSATTPVKSNDFLSHLFSRAQTTKTHNQSFLESLMIYSGFPEPLFLADDDKARLWRKSRTEKVIREDLRDLSRIPELSQIEMLVALLPERVGSLFSVASLREDLETSFPTLKGWLTYLKELYYLFDVKPYTLSVARTLKKEGKIYLWDYAEIIDEAARFENLVACHLLKACHYWTDSGEGAFELFTLRDKDKREIDFLITKDRHPWLAVEVKLTDTTPSPHFAKFLPQISCSHALQLVKQPGIWNLSKTAEGATLLVASAGEALAYFI